jgi:GNAT superfamily N-acetyltransferase
MASTFRRFLIGERAGEIVAIGQVTDIDTPADGVAARLVVDPAHRGAGHGRAMAEAVDRLLAARSPSAVVVRVAAQDEGSLSWAERRGFRPTYRMVRSRLELAGRDASGRDQALQALSDAGLDVRVPDDRDRLYLLYNELLRDVPEESNPIPRAVFDAHMDQPGFVVLVVAEGPAWAGMAVVRPMGQDGAWNAFTGVARGYRGRGVARALKVAATEAVAEQGRQWIETLNHSVNAPMLAVNRALGYRPVATTQFMQRRGPSGSRSS